MSWPTPAAAQGTAFTYQGRLNINGTPATGSYDFLFRLAADQNGVNLIGNPSLTNGVAVNNGLFTTVLDFGGGVFAGSNYWLEIQVRTNGGGGYSTLTPLQPLTPSPYAIFANSSSNLLGTLPAAQLSGTIMNSSLPANASFTGTVSAFALAANGAGVSNVNAQALSGLGSGAFWQLGGNSVAPGQFLGSTNSQALEIWVNGARGLRLEPGMAKADAPNIIGGAAANYVADGVQGATICGGGPVSWSLYFSNSISGDLSTIGGGTANTIQSGAGGSFLGAGLDNGIQTNASDSFVGGGEADFIQHDAHHSFLGGGYFNSIEPNAYGSFIGGGWRNTNSAIFSVTCGGIYNMATNTYATVPGGTLNIAGGQFSFAAGQQAEALHQGTFVWADSQNSPFASTANDQFNVRAQGGVRFVTGGSGMTIDGLPVLVSGGGSGLTIQQNSSGGPNVIGGASVNFVADGVVGATICGGGADSLLLSNSVSANYSTIGGGARNSIQDSASSSFLGAGFDNGIQTNADDSFLGGGEQNFIQQGADRSFLGGGYFNSIQPNAYGSFLGGGWHNTNGGLFSVTSGGYNNLATNAYATVPGGFFNIAGGQFSFAAGQQAQALHQGTFVWADSQAVPFTSAANDQFLIRARGGVGINTGSTPDSNLCINTNTYLFSHAFYFRGETGSDHNHGLAYNGTTVTNFGNGNAQVDGPVLWGFNGGVLGSMSGGARAVLTWSNNGVAINAPNPNGASLFVQGSRTGPFGNAVGLFENTNRAVNNAPALRVLNDGGTNADGALSVSANVSAGTPNGLIAEFGNNTAFVVTITNDGTIYCKNTVTSSDRNLKENFTPLDSELILAKVASMPITEWNFKDDTVQKHLGPMAQDFRAAFGLGPDDKHIATIDESGVALAAIQGLNQKLTEELKRRDAENAELKQRLEALEKTISILAQNR